MVINENCSVYNLGGRRRKLVSCQGLNVKTQTGEWCEADYRWVSSKYPSDDFQVANAPYKAYAKRVFGEEQQFTLSFGGFSFSLTPRDLVVTEDENWHTLTRAVGVDPLVRDSKLCWVNVYGEGTEFQWVAQPAGVNKLLHIQNEALFTNLPSSASVALVFKIHLPLNILRGFSFDSSNDFISLRRQGLTRALIRKPYFIDARGDVFFGANNIKQTSEGFFLYVVFRVADLKKAVYPIIIDPLITQTLTNTAFDLTIYTHNQTIDTSTVRVGSISAIRDSHGVYLFPELGIPRGAIINDAAISVIIQSYANNNNVVTIQIGLEDDSFPQAITSFADFSSRNWSWQNSVSWPVPSGSADVRVQTPDLTALVQHMVNRADWSESSGLQFLMRDVVRSFVANNRVLFRDASFGASTRPILTIDYVLPSVPPSPPQNLTAVAGNSEVDLSFSTITGATSYRVFRYTLLMLSNDTLFVDNEYLYINREEIYTGSSTTIKDTGVTNGQYYLYGVIAENAAGESDEVFSQPVIPNAGDLIPPNLLLNTRSR